MIKRISILSLMLILMIVSVYAVNNYSGNLKGNNRSQVSVFSNDFSYALSSWVTSGAMPSSAPFSIARSGDDWGARFSGTQLEITNDVGTTGNANGWAFVSTPTANFSTPYNTTLSSNTGTISWYFNFRQPRTDPAGFGITSYGVAVVLAGSSNTPNTNGNGYAIVLGQSGSTDPVRLVKYNNGIQGTMTNIITSNTTGLADFGVEYISCKVSYVPSTNTWELWLRNDGTTAFTDPMTGTLTSQGTAVDNTYTSDVLGYLGFYWQGSTGASQAAYFDNITVQGTVADQTPLITVSTTTLTGFTYVQGNGPSATQTFTVSGSNLTNNISIASPTDYEISLSAGSGYTTPITLTPTDGTVTATTIYVRLKAGLSVADYNNENITASSSGADNKTVSCSGSVTTPPSPSITVSVTSLTGFTYVLGSGPSATQTFTVSGANLTNDISLAAPTNYEISLSAASGYTTPITLTQSGGSVTTTTIYTRLKSGLAVGSYDAEDINITSTGATAKAVTCSGSVTAPVEAEMFLEENFTYTVGTTLVSNGWTAHSGAGTNSPTVASGSLTYTNYPPSSGNSAQTNGTTGEDVNKAFGAKTSGSVYVSFLFNVSSANTTGDYVFHMGPNAIGTDFKGRLFVQKDASNNLNFGLTKASAVGSAVWTGFNYAMNTTYLIVMRYDIVSGATNDLVYMWVNPTISGTEPSPLLTATDVTGVDAANIGAIAIRQGSTTPLAKFDGFRVTNNWAKLFEVPTPVIHVTGTLEEFSAYRGYDSATQSYTLHGSYLTENINITAPTGFKVNTVDSNWSTATNTLSVPNTFNGTIYVRMNYNTAGPLSGNIVHTSTGAAEVDLAVTGTVMQLPSGTINAEPTTLNAFSTNMGVPSDSQPYALWGEYLSGSIHVVVTAPFQILPYGETVWGTTFDLPYDFAADIYVRLNSANAGVFNGTITHSNINATDLVMNLTGTAIDPTPVLSVNPTTLTFSTNAGTPSVAQSVVVTSANQTAPVVFSSDDPYLFCTTLDGTYAYPFQVPANYNGNVYIKFNPPSETYGVFSAPIHLTSGALSASITMSSTSLNPNVIYATDLFFSEYVEGSSNRKAVEIFNGTGAAVNLANYSMKKQINGAGSFTNELVLSGTLANNDVYVIAYYATSNSLAGEPYVDYSTSGGVMSFNGNDCVALYHNGTQIDVVGIVDQVANWGADVTLVRKPTIYVPTTSFSFDDWISYPMDTFTYLGSHTFTPGQTPTATPTFDPAGGVYTTTQSVTISSTTPNATIRYTVDGTLPTATHGTIYNGAFDVSVTTTVKAVAYADGYGISEVAAATYVIRMDVATIAQLRSQNADGIQVYRLTGTAVLTFKQTFHNQKYFQDATAAILIEDLNGIITSTYAVNDGVQNLTGTLSTYGGMLQLTPTVNPGDAVSHNNVITPQEITIAELNTNFENYESELVKLMNVTFTGASGNFANGTMYPISDDSRATANFRTTFYDVDYIGTPVPTNAVNLVVIPNSRVTEGNLVTSRNLADITTAAPPEVPIVTIERSEAGILTLSWNNVGATSYRIEESDNPYSGWTTLVSNVTGTSYQITAPAAKKFYRVYAAN